MRQKLGRAPTLCSLPGRLEGQSWASSGFADFACKPVVSVQKTHMRVVEGRSATLTCQVSGTPLPAVRWLHDGQILPGKAEGSKYRITQLASKEPGNMTLTMSSSLTITNMSKNLAGLFTCAAINSGGVDEKTMILSIREPSPFSHLSWEFLFLFLVGGTIFLLTCLSLSCRLLHR